MNNVKVVNKNGLVGEGVGFERIRRITGYLVGTVDRFNNAKRAEVEQRVKHGVTQKNFLAEMAILVLYK